MPYLGEIYSLQNSHVKLLRRLRSQKRDRYRGRQFLAEGYRLVQHAVSRGYWPAFALYTVAFAAYPEHAELITTLASGEGGLWQVSDEVMGVLADTVTPPGLVAVFAMPKADREALRRADLVLIADGWRTPGNLGTLLRTALATGVGGVICAPGTVDPYAPKVVRGGMGAHFDLALLPEASWAEIELLTEGKQRVLAEAQASLSLWELDWARPTALIIGSEAHGPSAEARALATQTASVPMAPGAESLNAAIAAAAFLFEAQRQRSLAAR